MKNNSIQIRIIAALGMSARQYRNLQRSLFELWAAVLAGKQNLLLENLTSSQALWDWYREEFYYVELRFYKENKAYVDALLDAEILSDVLVLQAQELEAIYPSVIINKVIEHERENI
ncbi:hypothetical protein QP547_00855 [Weeksella virosa]|uniref:hypothetical protein n=2 Tax=Weeksella virosa TaxID=1014 RepID=UPI002556BA8B|nr:hypothetical protein [Weeksella virosa]MDK7674359.1 hypothetical protein [Weeksella virosa]